MEKELICLEVRINKEVRDYQESIFFGLSLRQFVFSVLAVIVAVGIYFCLRRFVGDYDIGWLCVLAAFPFALCGFFRYNGMNAEQFLRVFLRSEFAYPKRLLFHTENLYAQALESTSIKEALKLD